MFVVNFESLLANEEFEKNMRKLEFGIGYLKRYIPFLNSKMIALNLSEEDNIIYVKMVHTVDDLNKNLMDAQQFLRAFDKLVKQTAMEKLLNEGEEECPQQMKFNN